MTGQLAKQASEQTASRDQEGHINDTTSAVNSRTSHMPTTTSNKKSQPRWQQHYNELTNTHEIRNQTNIKKRSTYNGKSKPY